MRTQQVSALADEKCRQHGILTNLAFILGNYWYQKHEKKSLLPCRNNVKLLRYAAVRGHIKAMSILGGLLCQYGAGRIDKRQGVEFLKVAAKANETDAQYQLAKFYQAGNDVIPVDEKQSLYWITLAAEAGHRQAIEDLGEVERVQKNGVIKGRASTGLPAQLEKSNFSTVAL